jgi:hypothetical protein
MAENARVAFEHPAAAYFESKVDSVQLKNDPNWVVHTVS